MQKRYVIFNVEGNAKMFFEGTSKDIAGCESALKNSGVPIMSRIVTQSKRVYQGLKLDYLYTFMYAEQLKSYKINKDSYQSGKITEEEFLHFESVLGHIKDVIFNDNYEIGRASCRERV